MVLKTNCEVCLSRGGGWSNLCEECRRKIGPELLAAIDAASTEKEKEAVVQAAIDDPFTGIEASQYRNGEFDN